MKILITLISLMSFSTAAYANPIHNDKDITNCGSGDQKCLASNDVPNVTKNKTVHKNKKRHSKKANKTEQLNTQDSSKFDKKRNFNDADLEDTSKPNSFISETNSNNAPAKSPVRPPNAR